MKHLPITLLFMRVAVLAGFVAPPSDLTTARGYAEISVRYKQVPPGICELDPSVRSYAGYADVDVNQHIFWWFFEARNVDPLTAPLIIWINGGPGSSSMIGLFQELGPCRITSDGKVIDNPYSFSNVSNLLFVDQPTTVGFSYSIPVPAYVNNATGDIVQLPDNVCPDWPHVSACGTYSSANESFVPNNTASAAPNMWKVLQGFMGAFPQYARHGVHFATESYGGHYGPIFNEYFKMQNKKNIKGAQKIDLETVSIGNGWFSPLIQYQAYYNYTVTGNPYNLSPFTTKQEQQMYNSLYGPGNCVDQINHCSFTGIDEICSSADDFCYNEVEYLFDLYPKRDEYDMRELVPDPFPPNYYYDYLNSPNVLAAIGAFTNFTDYSNTVGLAFAATGDDAREDGTVAAMRQLLQQNVRVTMFTGDADYICNHAGGLVVSELIGAPRFNKAGWVNVTTSDSVVHGQVKAAGNFSYVRVYYSGHEVPFYQPLLSLEMFDRIINHKDIATGELTISSSYRTVGTAESTFEEGRSTVQHCKVPGDATYNTTTNEPNHHCNTSSSGKMHLGSVRQRKASSRGRYRKARFEW